MTELCKLKITRNKSGHIAEILCRAYMFLHGYRIIAHNYRCGTGKKNLCGEIDFIAFKKDTVVFCEVKQRKYEQNFMYALTPKQQQRIMNGAQFFMKSNKKYTMSKMRFDVFFVKLPFRIKHIKNALSRDRAL